MNEHAKEENLTRFGWMAMKTLGGVSAEDIQEPEGGGDTDTERLRGPG